MSDKAIRAYYGRLASMLPKDTGQGFYRMDLSQDEFIHFTSPANAQEILSTGKILLSKVRQGRPYNVYAVSSVWGVYLPGTQVPKVGEVSAILFRTNTIPKYGYPEEVLWGEDVILSPGAKEITFQEAIPLLLRNSGRIPEDTLVKYL